MDVLFETYLDVIKSERYVIISDNLTTEFCDYANDKGVVVMGGAILPNNKRVLYI